MARFIFVLLALASIESCFGYSSRGVATDRCGSAGEKYCFSCKSVGTCTDDGAGGYYLRLSEECSVACEEPSIGSAICSAQTSAEQCKCSLSDDLCKADPWIDPMAPGSAFVICTSGTPVFQQCESYETADVTNCDCVDVQCPTEPCNGAYIPPYEDGCGIFYYCGDQYGNFHEEDCVDGCFDTTTCTCVSN